MMNINSTRSVLLVSQLLLFSPFSSLIVMIVFSRTRQMLNSVMVWTAELETHWQSVLPWGNAMEWSTRTYISKSNATPVSLWMFFSKILVGLESQDFFHSHCTLVSSPALLLVSQTVVWKVTLGFVATLQHHVCRCWQLQRIKITQSKAITDHQSGIWLLQPESSYGHTTAGQLCYSSST